MHLSTALLIQILTWLAVCIPAITMHECAHGWMALYLGDPTARDAHRLSLNPLRHVDPVGTLLLPGLMIVAHVPFIFGWAKPVPVDFRRLAHGRFGVILVALAGPMANALMMIVWLILLHVLSNSTSQTTLPANSMGAIIFQIVSMSAIINLVLCLFNLMPFLPLDGGRVVGALLPSPLARNYARMEKYGTIILLILIMTGIFNHIFNPVVHYLLVQFGVLGTPS